VQLHAPSARVQLIYGRARIPRRKQDFFAEICCSRQKCSARRGPGVARCGAGCPSRVSGPTMSECDTRCRRRQAGSAAQLKQQQQPTKGCVTCGNGSLEIPALARSLATRPWERQPRDWFLEHVLRQLMHTLHNNTGEDNNIPLVLRSFSSSI
jgi:hypothetical protein